MPPSPTTHIVILNWNNWPDTAACLESCLRLEGAGHRITVVDNGSQDGSEAALRERFPGLDLVQTGANLGFAGGNNAGIRRALAAGAQYVWLLNNDTVVEPPALAALVEALEGHPEAACAGSKICYLEKRDKIWSAGGTWDKGRLALRQRGAYRPADQGEFGRLAEVGSLSGCSLLLRAAALRAVGLLDEGYFLYWEDTDWCARAGKRGMASLYVPASLVFHKVSATAGARSRSQYYYHTRNGLRFCLRHAPASLPRFLGYVSVDVLFGILKGEREPWKGYWRGISDFLAGRQGPLPREERG